MRNGTVVSIDVAGRLVIPKSIREAAGITATDQLEIRLLDDGAIELRPRPNAMRIEERSGIYVAVPLEPGLPLTEEDVEATRRQLRQVQEERGDEFPGKR